MDTTDHYKVAIVGAGASGLYTAYNLIKRGLTKDIVILEAEDRIGGRIHSIPFGDNWLEMGAEWIHGKGENPLWKFVQENKIPTVDDDETEIEGIFVREDGKAIPKAVLDETLDFLWDIHEEADKFADGYSVTQVPKSIGHFFNEKFNAWLNTEKQKDDKVTRNWRTQLFDWFIKYEESDCGCEDLYKLSSISWGEYSEYGTESNFKNGYKSVLEVMLNALKEAEIPILLNHSVAKINYENEKVEIAMNRQNSKELKLTCDHVVSTMSLGVLKNFHSEIFKPELPKPMINAITEIGFGSVAKIKINFEKCFWDQENPGLMILTENEPKIVNRDNWCRYVYGYQGVLHFPNMLMGWISGEAARFLETLSDDMIIEDLKKFLEPILKKYNQNPDWTLPKINKIFVTRWASNPNFRGVYSFRNQNCDLQRITNHNLSEPVIVNNFPRILFAGEATDKDHYGTVHGAMSSAVREVDRLEAFWKNNPEK